MLCGIFVLSYQKEMNALFSDFITRAKITEATVAGITIQLKDEKETIMQVLNLNNKKRNATLATDTIAGKSQVLLTHRLSEINKKLEIFENSAKEITSESKNKWVFVGALNKKTKKWKTNYLNFNSPNIEPNTVGVSLVPINVRDNYPVYIQITVGHWVT